MDTDIVQKSGTGNIELPADKFLELDRLIDKYIGEIGAIIRVMAEAQELFGYLPKKVMSHIASGLGVAPVKIYGIATFYSYFSIIPSAKHIITSCQGTACYVCGGNQVLDEFGRLLNIREGETTQDQEFSIKSVRCIGACVLAPVIKVDSDIYSGVVPGRVRQILAHYSKEYGVKK